MKILILSTTIFIFSIYSLKAGCDSLVVRVIKQKVDSGAWDIAGTEYDLFNGGLLKKSEKVTGNGYPFIHNTYNYIYDSISRLTEVTTNSDWPPPNGSLSKTNIFYSASGNDSAKINSQFNGSYYYMTDAYFYLYDSNNNIYRTFQLTYDTLQQIWDSTSYTFYTYSIDSLMRVDSTCNYMNPFCYGSVIITTWDTLGRISNINYIPNVGAGFSQDTFQYGTSCIYQIEKELYVSSGGLGWHYNYNTQWYYDSLCRPFKSVTQSVSGHDFSSDIHTDIITDYFYADCSHIVIAGDDSLELCPQQSDTVELSVFGGTGSYSYLWTPGDSLSSDTVLNPIIHSNAVSAYHLSVHDSIGNNSNFTLNVIPISCTSINEISAEGFKVFPNPAGNFLIIKKDNSESIKNLAIYNAIGQKEKTEFSYLNNESLEVKVSTLSSGVYFLEIQTETRNFVRKFIKE